MMRYACLLLRRSYGNIIISDMSGSYLFRMTVSHYKIRISRKTENRGILQAVSYTHLRAHETH